MKELSDFQLIVLTANTLITFIFIIWTVVVWMLQQKKITDVENLMGKQLPTLIELMERIDKTLKK